MSRGAAPLRRLWITLALAACSSEGASGPDSPATADLRGPDSGRRDAARDARARDGAGKPDLGRTDGAAGPCPPLMALVAGGTVCIDRYEAALEEQASGGSWSAASPYLTVGTRKVRAVPAKGLVPQGYISGSEAAAACAASGKRLCSSQEWLAACRGPLQLVWPYGNTHQSGACNDAFVGHPVVKYFGTSVGVWDTVHMNDPGINQQAGSVAKGGAYAQCVTAGGVYDLHGNLHEWVDDAAGTFRGGFYADASLNGNGCLYVTTAHAFSYHDYSTGFRCCTAPQ